MTDLSHWDFAENFLGYDAAALILGLEPRDSDREQWRVQVVTERMELHYKHVCERLQWEDAGLDHDDLPAEDREAVRPVELISVELDNLHRQKWLYGSESPLSNWLVDKRRYAFDMQQFSRPIIARWLKAIGMKSVYPFGQDQRDVVLDRWPWGKHHTELLGHLDAAARRYWGGGYDPSDTGTASTNATVSEWLQTERKVSRTMADSIASMLRPDGLPTGPRK
jgi:hypothetical protein